MAGEQQPQEEADQMDGEEEDKEREGAQEAAKLQEKQQKK